jgi:hypothetical protein
MRRRSGQMVRRCFAGLTSLVNGDLLIAEVLSPDQEEADMATQQDTRQAEATAAKLATLRDDVRATIGRADDPQLKAALETGAEVLGGLRQAFVDYGKGSEEAWQR